MIYTIEYSKYYPKLYIMKKIILFALGLMMTLGAQAQKQVYTVFNNGTLTYYYDDQMDTRQGIKEVYKPGSITPRFQDYCTEVKIGVIDASMKEAPLTSLKYMFYGNHYYNGSQDFSFPLENKFLWCRDFTSIFTVLQNSKK